MSFQASKCPMCGGGVPRHARTCGYCSSTLIPVPGGGPAAPGRPDPGGRLPELREKARANPSDPFILYAIGLAYLGKGLPGPAAEAMEKAIRIEPEHAVLHYSLALALSEDGRAGGDKEALQRSFKHLDDAITLDPGFSEALALRHFFNATRLANVDMEEAAREYRRGIAICPDIAAYHIQLGVCLIHLRRWDEAVAALADAIALAPEDFTAHTHMAKARFEQGRFAEGAEAGRKAVDNLRGTSPLAGWAYHNLGVCLWELDRKDEAMEMMKKAVALDGNEPEFHRQLNLWSGRAIPVQAVASGNLGQCPNCAGWVIKGKAPLWTWVVPCLFLPFAILAPPLLGAFILPFVVKKPTHCTHCGFIYRA